MSNLQNFNNFVCHQLKLALVNKFFIINSLVFYIICLSLFNIAIGPYQLSESVKIALLYTPLCLAIMLGSQQLIHNELKNGVIHQLLISSEALEWFLIGKLVSCIILYAVAVIFLFPIACLVLGIPLEDGIYIICSGITLVSFICPVLLLTSCMTSSNSFNILLPILILPILIPALILVTLAYQNNIYLLLLIAITLLVLPVCIFASSYLVKNLIRYE